MPVTNPIPPRIRAWLHEAWNTIYEFGEITDRRHIFLLASGIAYNQLLCLIPLVLLVISIISGFIDEQATKESVRNFLVGIMPNVKTTDAISAVLLELGTVFSYSTIAGWIAGVALLWTASALFSSMRTGLNAIFHIPTPKFFVVYRLKDMLLTIITAILVMMTTLVTPLLSLIGNYGTSMLPDGVSGVVSGITAQIISMATAILLFFVLYRFMPNKKLPWPIILISTLSAFVLWEVARAFFSWYMNTATNFSRFYGGYVAFASLALWLYYLSLVFLISAEIGQFVYVKRTQHRPPEV